MRRVNGSCHTKGPGSAPYTECHGRERRYAAGKTAETSNASVYQLPGADGSVVGALVSDSALKVILEPYKSSVTPSNEINFS